MSVLYNHPPIFQRKCHIQDVTDLNVVDAKRLLDNLPCLVKTNLEVEEANKIKEVLENVGVMIMIVVQM